MKIKSSFEILAGFLVLTILACADPQHKRENFDVFFEKFHKDSLFQMNRIDFPLPGLNTDDMDIDDTAEYYWQKDEWIMHRIFDLSEFDVDFMKSDSLVIEKISSPNNPGWLIERRFEMRDSIWFLIYYKDINL